jgi:hypothetical protein
VCKNLFGPSPIFLFLFFSVFFSFQPARAGFSPPHSFFHSFFIFFSSLWPSFSVPGGGAESMGASDLLGLNCRLSCSGDGAGVDWQRGNSDTVGLMPWALRRLGELGTTA